MKELILLVGPPGSGKSTFANKMEQYFRVNQDEQGKDHLNSVFIPLLEKGTDIVVDRMNFSKEQRNRYLKPAKENGYSTRIIVLHVPEETCRKRCLERENHPTVKTPEDASKAINFFFSKYERISDDEADVVERWGWNGDTQAVIIDIDGTMAKIDHRLHFVQNGNKNWKDFFKAIPQDTPNKWCRELAYGMALNGCHVVLASGRPDDHRKVTEKWLDDNGLGYSKLFMRRRGDYRPDDVVKEIILEFELKTRYDILFVVDDRLRVVKMWRRHGLTALACAEGDF